MAQIIKLTEEQLNNVVKNISEDKMKKMKNPCWKGYKAYGTKMKNGKKVPNCVPINEHQVIKLTDLILEKIKVMEVSEEQFDRLFEYQDETGSVESTDFIANDILNEAEHKGKKVKLGKIMQGDVKKFKVYVKNDKGKVVKVNFGFGGKSAHGKRMVIKKNNPERRKSFRARMKCDNPGPRWKPRYWACRTW